MWFNITNRVITAPITSIQHVLAASILKVRWEAIYRRESNTRRSGQSRIYSHWTLARGMHRREAHSKWITANPFSCHSWHHWQSGEIRRQRGRWHREPIIRCSHKQWDQDWGRAADRASLRWARCKHQESKWASRLALSNRALPMHIHLAEAGEITRCEVPILALFLQNFFQFTFNDFIYSKI